MKVLLIEDDERISEPIAEELVYNRYAVDAIADGKTGLQLALNNPYDIILLDIMLPGIDGLTICHRLRQAGCPAKILMLTARDTTSDVIIGLDAGADDYLIKPFKIEELLARLRALNRRPTQINPDCLQYDGLELDSRNQTVCLGDRPLQLTPKEFLLLEIFLRNPRQVFSKPQLLDRIGSFESETGEDTIKAHIANLRRKLKSGGGDADLIETVYGVGYRLKQK